jgi:hypothetical protein
MDENWMKWPERCLRSTGRAALVTLTTPNRFVSIWAAHQLVELLRTAGGRDHPVSVLEHGLGEFPPEAA